MRINSWNTPLPEIQGPSERPAGATRAAMSAENDSADEARLSFDRRRIHGLESEVARMTDVREERVSRLREEIAAGRYRADADQVASAILANMLGGSATVR